MHSGSNRYGLYIFGVTMFIKRDNAQSKTYGPLALHDVISVVDGDTALCFLEADLERDGEGLVENDEAMMARFIQMQIEAKALHKNVDFDFAIEDLNDSEEYLYWQYSAHNTPLKMKLLNAQITFKYRSAIPLQSLISLALSFQASLYDEHDKKIELVEEKKSIFGFLGF